jgi:hypothetical protein
MSDDDAMSDAPDPGPLHDRRMLEALVCPVTHDTSGPSAKMSSLANSPLPA